MRSRAAFAVQCLMLACCACGGGSVPAAADTGLGSTDALADTAVPDSADASHSDIANPGIGKICQTKTDCAGDLVCQEINAATGEGFCTKTCDADAVCGAGRFCNAFAQKFLCMEPQFCNPCNAAGDCSAGAPLCLQDKGGQGYCSRKCSVGDSSCAPGSSCHKYGSDLGASACTPDYGSCSGDGSNCSPCIAQADCSPGTTCFTSPATGERYCAQTCEPTATNGCPQGFACAAQKTKSIPGLCWKKTPAKPVATCAKGDKGYCDACNQDWECASSRCASKNGMKFCVEPTPCSKATEGKDCPYGGYATFCVPTDKGMACVPPPNSNCQGYKSCLGHDCAADEACDNGICKKK